MKELDNFTCRGSHVLAKQLQLLWRTAMVIATVFLLNPVAFAQDTPPDLPPASSCVAQDLEAIEARLVTDSPCLTCEEGQEVISTLELGIYNKTGSTRTSVGFWATLVITDESGNTTISYISGCSSPIEGGDTEYFPFNEEITYTCGDQLKLTNVYLAWTPASDNPNNQCPLDAAGIAPKCRAQTGELVIIPPLSASVDAFEQPCVGEANGSINVSVQGGSGTGYTYTLNPGGITNSTGVFTNLAADTYTITIEDSEECSTQIQFELEEQVCCVPPTVTAQPGDESVCEGEAASFTVGYTGGEPAPTIRWQMSTDGTNWTYVENGGAYSGATTATLSISATTEAMDGNMYRAELTSGTCEAVYSDAADLEVNEIPDAPTSGGDQVVCATNPIQTLTASATAPEGITIVWYTAATGGTVVESPTLNTVGTVTYYAQAESEAGCISTTRTAVTLTINETPDAPVVEDDEFCATTGTVTLADYIEADGDVIFTDADGNALEVQPTTLSRATAGVFTYYVVQVDGECESEVASFTITINEVPDAPEVTVVHPTCATAGSITVTAPLGEGLEYSIDGGTTWQSEVLFADVAPGTYTVWVRNADDCRAMTDDVVVNPVPDAPAAPTVVVAQPTCTNANATITITSNTEGLLFSFNGGAYAAYPAGGWVVTTAGEYTVIARNEAMCVSAVVRVTVNPQPETPAAPELDVVNPTCAVATGTLLITSDTEGLTFSVNGAAFVAYPEGGWAGLAPGDYEVIARNADECESEVAEITIEEQPATPAAPVLAVVNPTCTVATGTLQITSSTTGLVYSVNGGAYVAYPVGGWTLAPGDYVVTARNEDGCISAAAEITIEEQPATPAVPTVTVVQPTCTVATGTITVTAPLGEGLQYSINDGDTWQDGTVFAGLAPGTYTIWVENEAGCRAESAEITINAQPATPAAPTVTVVQPTCAAGGSITVTAPLGAGLEYSINGSTWQSGVVFAGIAPGTYTVWVRNAAGCEAETGNIVINPVPAAPAAPVVAVTQPTCAVATGTIVITSGTDGLMFSFNGGAYAAYPANGWVVAPGSYTLSAMNSAQCISGNIIVVVNPQPETPAAPTVTVVHPTCTVATGSITVIAPLDEGYQYSINDGDNWQTGTTFTGLAPGNYTVWVENADGCRTESANITINAQPTAPAAPTLTAVQPTCETAGSITVTSPTGEGLQYSINDGETWQSATVFANVGAGTYTVWVRNAAGCMTESDAITINPVPAAPAAPTVMVTQPTCTSPTAMIMITSSTEGLVFSLNGGTYAAYPAGGWAVTAPGEYTVTARNAAMCVSGATRVGVNAQPATPAAPTARVDQPTCTMLTGTITVTAPMGEGMMYSLNGGAYQASVTFSGLAAGNYTLTARNAAGCTSGSTAVTINSAPSAPAAPSASVTQPTCLVPMGMITITAPTGAGMMYSLNGGAYQASVNFGDLLPGSYTITARNAAGCVSAATTVVVNNQPGNNAPIVKCETSGFTYEDHEKGLFNVMHTSYGLVGVTARKRNPDGTYAFGNHAALFDTQAPTGDDTDLYTTDWGLAAIINQDQTDVPNDNQWGGEIIFNFADIGPVTMQSLKALDIDSYENMSWVYLYDKAGNELYKVQLQNIGNNSKQVVDLGNTRDVMTMKVVLDGRNESGHLAGSGAIDEIEFCVEETGSDCETVGFPYADHSIGLTSIFHTPWGDVDVMGRKRNPDGSFATGNYAALFDTQNPTGDDTDLFTADWGLALIINQDQTNVPNDNRYGGELIIDFSNIGPVTMQSMKALDIDRYSNNGWVYLYDADGEELYRVQLKNLGDNTRQDVDLGGTKGVMRMKVVFDGRDEMGNLTGSGAIDEIRFCVESPCVDVAIDDSDDTEAIEVMAIDNVKAYPTPFRDKATIEFTVKNTEEYVVNLYDTKGMLVKQLKAGTAVAGELNTVEVDGGNMAEGMYLARIATGSGAKTVKLILKR